LGKTRPTYTWTRTNKGPQKSWLHHIGKTEDPSCACGHPTQDGDILVFHCPLMAPQRAQLLPLDISTWETLDDPHWIAEAGGDDDDDDDTSDYSSPLRGMSSLPEARQDSRGRQVNLVPHANYIHIPMGDGLCVSAKLPLPFIVCRDEHKKLGRPRGEAA